MSTAFSVYVNIGGRLNSSLPSSINAATRQLEAFARRARSLDAVTNARVRVDGATRAAQVAVNQQRGLTNVGANTMAVSAPLGIVARGAAEMVFQYENAGNALRRVTEMSTEQRREIERVASMQRYFSPREAMQAAVELGRTGFNYEQIRGTLGLALQLARAGDITAQQSTDIVTNVMTAMQLPMATAEQARASLQRVGDVMAYTAARTNTDMRLLGDSFRYAGNAASTMGIDVETLAAVFGRMANVGIRGAEAGTAVRSAIVRLIRPTRQGLAAMNRLGVNLGDYVTQSRQPNADDVITTLQGRGIDASSIRSQIQGILRPGSQFSGDTVEALTNAIATSMGGNADAAARDRIAAGVSNALLGSANRIDFAGFLNALRARGASATDIAQIFEGRQVSRQMAMMMFDAAQEAERVRRESAGYLQRATELQMEGIVGSYYRMQAAWNNLLVTMGRAGVIDTVASAFERIADAIGRLSQTNPALLRFATWSLLAVAAIGPLLLILSGIAAMASPAVRALLLLAAAGRAIANNWAGITAWTGGFLSTLEHRFPRAARAVRDGASWLQRAFMQVAQAGDRIWGTPEQMREWGTNAAHAIGDFISRVQNVDLSSLPAQFGAMVRSGFASASAMAAPAIAWAQGVLAQTIAALSTVDWSSVGSTVGRYLGAAISTAGGLLSDAFLSLGPQIVAALNSVDWNAAGRSITAAIMDAIGGAASSIRATLGASASSYDWGTLGRTIANLLTAGILAGLNFVQGIFDEIGSRIANALRSVDWSGLWESLRSSVSSIDWAGIAAGVLAGIAQIQASAMSAMISVFSDLGARGREAIAAVDWAGVARAASDSIDAALRGGFANIGAVFADLASRGREAVLSIDWAGLGTAIVDAIVRGVSSAGSALIERLRSLATEALNAARSMIGDGGLRGAGSPAPGGVSPSSTPGGAATGVFPGSGVGRRRATGGQVSWGMPYLVGERGPELFFPGASGRIETNAMLSRLMSGANDNSYPSASMLASASGRRGGGTVSSTHTWHISGAQDPAATAREVERVLARYEAEQRGFLND